MTPMHLTPDYHIGMCLALRARFVSISFWLLVTLAIVALLAAQFSARQPATVALDVGLSFIRLALPLMIVFQLQELFAKEFDRRYFLTSLTYPRPRHQLFLGRFLALYTLLITLLVIMGLLLGVLVGVLEQDYAQSTPVALTHPYFITLGFIAIDLFVITAVGAFFAIIATTPSFILIGTIGFMIVARSFSTIIAMLGGERIVMANQQHYQESLGLLAYLLPDLASLDVRMITLYNTMDFLPANWPALIAGSLAYSLAFMGLTLWVLQRRRFS